MFVLLLLLPHFRIHAFFGGKKKGATWEVVYQRNDTGLFMNDISCASKSHCVAVAEGPAAAVILTTRDAGATWATFVADKHSRGLPILRKRNANIASGKFRP